MNYVGAIALTADERSLFERIIFESLPYDREVYLQNAEAVPKLMESLLSRDAIPAHRLAYFDDPKYQSGRLKASHRSLFERNGTSGQAILEHLHFLKYLRYFLFGADLPEDAINEFKAKIESLGQITSSDAREMCKAANAILNRYRLELRDAAEEFFKLCLDRFTDVRGTRSRRGSQDAASPDCEVGLPPIAHDRIIVF